MIVIKNRDFNIDQNNRDYDFGHNRAALVATVFQNLAKFAQHLTFISFLCSRFTREYSANHTRVLLTAPPTGLGLESIQKIAELILNCREKNRDTLLNRYFYPTQYISLHCLKQTHPINHTMNP